MRLPALGLVVWSAQRAALRFPLVLAAGLLAASAGIALINRGGGVEAPYVRLLVTATLGLPLFFALTLAGERRAHAGVLRWAAPGIALAALLAFWASWPRWSEPIQAARYAQLSAAFHLLAAVLPYAGYDEPNGFWQYNKALFLRFLTAGLYSSVLFAGLAVALLALDKLLGIEVPGEGYARLWLVMAFIFNTWFFVGGVPADLPALHRREDYPTGLRIFTQYVLVPLVGIYLLILTIYLGKVLVTREWPSGWIGYLVSGVAAVGILAWLLVRPLEDRAEHAWVKTYTRGFYLVLMPSVVMLWLAIWKRVGQYGITERRYFLIVLSLWLAGIAVYYTVRRSRNIKLIPASLCALALLTFAGPWGAYRVSRGSQVRRLEGLLVRNDLMANDVVRPASRAVSFEDRKEISGALGYLIETHGEAAIAPWFGDSLARVARLGRGGRQPESRVRAIMLSLGLDYVGPRARDSVVETFSHVARRSAAPVPIGGYTHAVHLLGRRAFDSVPVAERTVVRLTTDSTALALVRNGRSVLELPLAPVAERAAAYERRQGSRTLPAEILRAEVTSGNLRALVYFTYLAGRKTPSGVVVTSLEGELFLRLP